MAQNNKTRKKTLYQMKRKRTHKRVSGFSVEQATSKWRTESDDSDHEICTFAMKGCCTASEMYGTSCIHSHEVPIIKCLKPCKYYMDNTCHKRDTCTYMHEDFPCKFYHLNGWCTTRDGKPCKFSHERTDTTVYLLDKLFENQYESKSGASNDTSVRIVTDNTLTSQPSKSSPESQQQFNPAIPPPVIQGFYLARNDDIEKDTSTPFPSVFTDLLVSDEDEPMENVESSSDDEIIENNPLYPSKTISVTLPPLDNSPCHVDNDNDRLVSQVNAQMRWTLRKVICRTRIDYKSIRSLSSAREILMDPRLSKNRCS